MQYVFVFLERLGYPIELQIGHKFAFYTFAENSALRDSKEHGEVSLRRKNFYNAVLGYILDKCNGITATLQNDIQNQAKELYQNNIPEKLQVILNNL